MRRERAASWLIVIAAAAYLAAGFAWGTTSDEEEYRISILTTLLHARGLTQGQWPLWTSELGLGMPHPLGQSFIWHPLMPLLAWMRPDRWVVLLLATQLVVGAIGMMQLCRLLGLRPIAAAAATATFILASTTQNYVLSDFWPSGFLIWTLWPVVLAFAMRLLDARNRATRLQSSLALGLVAGLVLANGHPGAVLVYGVPGLVFLGVHARRALASWPWWLAAALVMLALAAPTIVHLGPELLRFPAGLPRANYDNPLRLGGLWDLFVRPLPIGAGDDVLKTVAARGTRVSFFGPPFAVLAVIMSCSGAAWRKGRRDLVLAFVVSFAILCTPGLSALKALSATWLFRDPMSFFGMLLAALAIDGLWRRGRVVVAGAIVAAQLGCLAVAVWPFLQATLNPDRRQPARMFSAPAPVIQWLRDRTRHTPGRVYYSMRVDGLVMSGDLVEEGLWRNTPAYHRLRAVSGVFKGISTDEISPSESLPYGQIRAVPPLQRSTASLGVLGFRYVLALEGEEVAPEFRRVDAFSTKRDQRLVLYECPEVTSAIVVPRAVLDAPGVWLAGCPHRGVLCRDFSAIWAARSLAASPRVTGANGHLEVTFASPVLGGVVVVGEMFRAGWGVTSVDGFRDAGEVLGGLIAVDPPTGATAVHLDYRPVVRVGAVWVAGLTVGLALLTLAVAGLAPHRQRAKSEAGVRPNW